MISPVGAGGPEAPARSMLHSVRLTPGQTGEIQRIAEAAGIPARGAGAWLCCRGWRPGGLVEPTIEALWREVARLRRQLTGR